MWFKRSRENKNIQAFNSEEPVELIFVREKYNEYTTMFFNANGINITHCFRTLQEAELALFTSGDKVRLIIVEEGLGDFTTMTNRKGINSLLGICDGDGKKAIVFYSSGVVVTDNKMFKHVNFIKFTNTQDIIDTINRIGEKYINTDGKLISREEKVLQAIHFKGESLDVENQIDLNETNIQLNHIMQNGTMFNCENELEGFKIKW